MAVSTSTVTLGKPHHLLHTHPPLPLRKIKCNSSNSKKNASFSSSNTDSKLSLEPIPTTKRGFFYMGFGLLASSIIGSVPFASATRIEYYATVGEPSCELNFARSGLGYCDIAVGSGVEPPLGELINVLRGLDQGILGGGGVPPMLVGGKRKLHIPPELAYGPEPAGCFSALIARNITENMTMDRIEWKKMTHVLEPGLEPGRLL
ncbi:FK506-binding protein 16-2 isoform X3 [Tasmannia lanceolata]|uniref:FK506-binding protein 16-2 isoform X3 n=1 Tax=Tasmannia lanceolata TaxID=3420 RepID=UPI004062C0A3